MTSKEDIQKNFGYDYTNQLSILDRAKILENKTVKQVLCESYRDAKKINKNNKGNVGNIIEEYWFGINNNSSPKPDFEEAGIELKVVPLKRNNKNSLVVKERTKICSIDYGALLKETWCASHAKTKLNKVLFVFYEYDSDDIRKSTIKKTSLWELKGSDEKIIKQDWLCVFSKVHEGYAHLLSETISNVLAASRSGSGGKNSAGKKRDLVPQPTDTHEKEALKRAFSLKRSFTEQYWASLKKSNIFESMIESMSMTQFNNFETILLEHVNKNSSKSIGAISEKNGLQVSNSKSAVANIMKKAIGFKNLKSRYKELEQLGIQIKTLSVRTSDNRPWESTPFPAFKLKEFAKEKWSDSQLLSHISRILFIPIYRQKKDTPIEDRTLGDAFFWSPTDTEVLAIAKEWEKYKKEVNEGKCKVTNIPWGKRHKEVTSLSKESDTEIIHIRPHGATTAGDRDEDPCGNTVVKQSFWLNKKFTQQLLQNSSNAITYSNKL